MAIFQKYLVSPISDSVKSVGTVLKGVVSSVAGASISAAAKKVASAATNIDQQFADKEALALENAQSRNSTGIFAGTTGVIAVAIIAFVAWKAFKG